MIEAYITNLGKYAEGDLCGEYLKLPATKAEVEALLSKIGLDGILYEEYFITDYKTDIPALSSCLGEYESIDELNYLANLLTDIDLDTEKFKAALVYADRTHGAQDLINLAKNLDCYEFYPDIDSNEDLGRFYIEEMCALEVPEHLEGYFDYEAYGRDMYLNESSNFINGGYIVKTSDSFTEHYSGREDLPEEFKIFAYPDPPQKMPIQKQLEMYGGMVLTQNTAGHIPARNDR